MHIISYKKIREFITATPESENAMSAWYRIVKNTDFSSFADIKSTFPSADWVKGFVVFNIGGNKYRLIAYPNFTTQRLFIRYVLTHQEYDEEKWKTDKWYSK
jgi:mRNA interferase HigB